MSNFDFCTVLWCSLQNCPNWKIYNEGNYDLYYVTTHQVIMNYFSVHQENITTIHPNERLQLYEADKFRLLEQIFILRNNWCDLWGALILSRRIVNHVNDGLKSFRTYGAKIGNSLPLSCNSALTLTGFDTVIKSWNGQKCKCSICHIYIYVSNWDISVVFH